ncbi:MAG: efflux RND transporter periplasmic adaptor subunit [Microgenomates group bacterium]
MKNFLFKNKKIFWGVGGLILTFLLVFFLKIKPSLQSPEEKYQTTKVRRGNLKITVSASGKIEAEKQVTLRFQTGGLLSWVGVRKGDKVKKWQTIASLDTRELEKDLKKRLLAYMNQRWDFEQTQDNYNVHGKPLNELILTEEEKRILEKAQFNLDSTVLDVEIRDLSIKLAKLVSPIEGIVVEAEPSLPGVNILPTNSYFTIIDPSQMKFVADVDEVDIGKVKLDQKAIITLDAYENQTFEGKVKKISFAAITTKGGGTAFPVEISLPENHEEKFKWGMNGDVEIIIEEVDNALIIPSEAIIKKEGKNYVKVLEKGKIKEKEITTGLETEEEIEILSGLQEGDIIILSEK